VVRLPRAPMQARRKRVKSPTASIFLENLREAVQDQLSRAAGSSVRALLPASSDHEREAVITSSPWDKHDTEDDFTQVFLKNIYHAAGRKVACGADVCSARSKRAATREVF